MDYDAAVLEGVAKRFRRDMWDSAPEDAVAESGVEARSFGPVQATVFAEFAEVPRVNVIEAAAEPGAVAGGYLAEAIEWMRTWEVDYRVRVAAARPGSGEAEEWLSSRGYECYDGGEKLVRDTSPPDFAAASGIEVLELNPTEGEGMDSIASESLGLPLVSGLLFYELPNLESWRCYVALLDGELVACGSMLIDGGIAELGVDGTKTDARTRGCNQALLHRRLLDAANAGCHTVFADLSECEPGADGAIRHNLLRAGFGEAYDSSDWQRPGYARSGMERRVRQSPRR